MAPQRSTLAPELESRLREGLSALRAVSTGMGAQSVSVFLVKESRTMRTVYVWPDPGREYAEVPVDRAFCDALRTAAHAPENSPVARFLQGTFQPGGNSFLTFSAGPHRLSITIAFGFAASHQPAPLPAGDAACTVNLALTSAWSVYEVLRLHSELAVVNERLGKRKLIERAKGMLQAERGLDEQQAYEHLRRLSRQRRTRMSEVARDLLGTSHFP